MDYNSAAPKLQPGKKQMSDEEKKWLQTEKHISKSQAKMAGYDEVFGLLSWNYKHDTKQAGTGGSDLTKKALLEILDDVSIDIFAMQELLWTGGTEVHIRRKNDKFEEKDDTFKVISTVKESGLFFNSSLLNGEKVDHIQTPTIDESSFEYNWNTRTCIGKFTDEITGLVFHVASYHGPSKAGDPKKEDFSFQFFKRIEELQNKEQYPTPFFIAGDFNFNIEESKQIENILGLTIVSPDLSELEGEKVKTKKLIDFVCVLNAKKSKWQGVLFGAQYENVNQFKGVSTHPPIFTYLCFKKSVK